MKKQSVVAAKITPKLRQEIQEIMTLGYWISESDFVRDAIKTHIIGYKKMLQEYTPKLAEEEKKE